MKITKKSGLLITLEGIEGAGKSSAVQFIKNWLQQANISHVITREPGGTPIAEAIRQVLLKDYEEMMYPDTELLLMFASRAQHIANLIKPALLRGDWVISDRFTDASYAYQGGGRGIDLARISKIEHWVHANLRPDRVILLDIPVELAMSRIRQRETNDRIEQEKLSFFRRVRETYLARAVKYPERYMVIDASQPMKEVESNIKQILDCLKVTLP